MDQRQARSDCVANVIRCRTQLEKSLRTLTTAIAEEPQDIHHSVNDALVASIETFARSVAQLAVMEMVTVNVNPYPHLVEVGPSGIDSPTHYRGPRVGA